MAVVLVLLIGAVSGVRADSASAGMGMTVAPDIPRVQERAVPPERDPEETAAAEWARAGFKRPRIGTLRAGDIYDEDGETEFTHEISITIVAIREGGWTAEIVESRFMDVAAVYAQCGVRFNDVLIVEAGSPTGSGRFVYKREESMSPKGFGTIAGLAPRHGAAVMFYVDRFEDNVGQPGTSRPRFQYGEASEAGTVWLTSIIRSEHHGDHYNVDAHELTHVLADYPHSTRMIRRRPGASEGKKQPPGEEPFRGGDLMAGNPIVRTNTLTPELCGKIKENPRARAVR